MARRQTVANVVKNRNVSLVLQGHGGHDMRSRVGSCVTGPVVDEQNFPFDHIKAAVTVSIQISVGNIGNEPAISQSFDQPLRLLGMRVFKIIEGNDRHSSLLDGSQHPIEPGTISIAQCHVLFILQTAIIGLKKYGIDFVLYFIDDVKSPIDNDPAIRMASFDLFDEGHTPLATRILFLDIFQSITNIDGIEKKIFKTAAKERIDYFIEHEFAIFRIGEIDNTAFPHIVFSDQPLFFHCFIPRARLFHLADTDVGVDPLAIPFETVCVGIHMGGFKNDIIINSHHRPRYIRTVVDDGTLWYRCSQQDRRP